jgi:hypothetical protein
MPVVSQQFLLPQLPPTPGIYKGFQLERNLTNRKGTYLRLRRIGLLYSGPSLLHLGGLQLVGRLGSIGRSPAYCPTFPQDALIVAHGYCNLELVFFDLAACFSSWFKLQPTGDYSTRSSWPSSCRVTVLFSHFVILVDQAQMLYSHEPRPCRIAAMCQCISFSTGTSLSQQARASTHAVIDLCVSRNSRFPESWNENDATTWRKSN